MEGAKGRTLALATSSTSTPPPPRTTPYVRAVGLVYMLQYICCCWCCNVICGYLGASLRTRFGAWQPPDPAGTSRDGWHPAAVGNADARRGGRRSREGWRLLAEPPSLRGSTERSVEEAGRNDRVVAKGVVVTRCPPRIWVQRRITKAQRPVCWARFPAISSLTCSHVVSQQQWVGACSARRLPPAADSHLPPLLPGGASTVLDAARRHLPPSCALANWGLLGTIT